MIVKQRHARVAFFLESHALVLHLPAMIGATSPLTKSPRYGIVLVLSLATALWALQGCGSQTESGMNRMKRTGSLRIGTDATYPPFETVDTETSEIVGFDIDLVKEICRELQCSPDFVVTPFDGIVAGLNTCKYDLIASSFTITPERAEQVAFTNSYYDAGQALAVPTYDTTIRSVKDLMGKSVGVQLGTTGERRAHQIPGVRVVPFESISAAFIDMENGRLDAVVNDRPTTEILIRQRGSAKIVGQTLTAEEYGFAVRSHDRELLEAVNAALTAIRADGRYQVIRDRWFGAGG
jgi:ABC-type amino acid transport substrate-binding protein